VKEVCAKDLVIKAGPIRSIPVKMQAAVHDGAQDMVEFDRGVGVAAGRISATRVIRH
jgi:hypothetical protein